MQATVSAFDTASRAGMVLLDDGVELSFTAGAIGSGVRFLRPGQRVRLTVSEPGRQITQVQIITLPG